MVLGLKFSLDTAATPLLKWAICYLAIIVSVLFAFCTYAADRGTNQLQARRAKALEKLKKDNDVKSDELHLGHTATRLMIAFVCSVALGWVAILQGWLD